MRDELVPAAVGATSVRALFISDVHLGTEGCQAELLLDFLRHYDANQIYLVGDIVDGWRLKAKWYWPQSHDEILQCLSDKVLAGARLFYIPGNHDEFLRRAVGLPLDGIEVLNHVIHEGIDGRRYLVVHGDQFDLVVTHARWLALLGDATYNAALVVNSHLNRMHRSLGLTWLSVATWAKLKITDLVVYISRFDKVLAAEARRHNVHGIICGHFHNATINESSGVKYINTGDWVESCTAVVEHLDGRFEVVRWAELLRDRAALGMVPLRPLESGAVSFRKESRALPETGSDVDPGVLSSKAAVL